MNSRARAILIQGVQKNVLYNNRVAWANALEMEKYLGGMYKQAGDKLIADINALRAKVEQSGGEWSLADLGKHQRMENLMTQIQKQIQELGEKEVIFMQKNLSNVYTDQYLRTIYTLGKAINVNISMDTLNPKAIAQAVNYPWSGAMFSDRIWDNKAKLVTNIRNGITQGLILGESMGKVAQRINEGIDNSTYNAMRVARTEVMRVSYVAEAKGMKESGVGKVEYYATEDERTCKICGKHHKKVFDLGQELQLPLHPHCRCTYIPVIEDIQENGYNDVTGSIRGSENYINWQRGTTRTQEDEKIKKAQENKRKLMEKRKAEKANSVIQSPEHIFSGEHGAEVAKSFNPIEEMERYKAQTPRQLEQFKQLQKVGITSDKFKEAIQKLEAMQEYYDKGIDKVFDVDYVVKEIKGTCPNGDILKKTVGYVDITEYEEMSGGKYFIHYTKRLSKEDKARIENTLDKLIEKNPRAIGIKIKIDNADLDSVSKKGSITLGYHAPWKNTVVMRDFKNYEKHGFDGVGQFTKTLAHELGHRVHSSHPKVATLAMSAEQWAEWHDLTETYYQMYHVNKLVDFTYGKGKEWSRFNYAVSAQDVYSDNDKEHFFQELFAESTAVLQDEREAVQKAEEMSKLNKYFPKVKEFLEKIYSVGGNAK